METIKYELKYCERCGTLKLRQVASVSTYCHRCEELLARFTFPAGKGDTNGGAVLAPPASHMLTRIPLVAVNDRLAGRVQ
jgi:hypothetical protein